MIAPAGANIFPLTPPNVSVPVFYVVAVFDAVIFVVVIFGEGGAPLETINGTKNRNYGKDGDGNVGGRRREEISTSQGNNTHNLLKLSAETASVRCMLGEI